MRGGGKPPRISSFLIPIRNRTVLKRGFLRENDGKQEGKRKKLEKTEKSQRNFGKYLTIFCTHAIISNCADKAAEQRITQINNELNTQKVIQKHCDSYRLCRKVIEDCKSAKNPNAYRTKHQAEYQLHDSLKKELQDLGVTKIPSSNKIQKRIENLESEQAATVREKQELQKKQKTLDIIRQNFTALLNSPEISSDLLPAKREPISVTRDK